MGQWSSVLAVPVTTPPTDETTPTVTDTTTAPSASIQEQALLYGTVVAVVLLVCTVLVGVILCLKYLQISHRDTDKGQSAIYSSLYTLL